MSNTGYIGEEKVSGPKLLALDLGISGAGVAADLGIGWGIASGAFGVAMTPAIAVGMGIAAVVGVAVGTGAMLLMQGANR